MDNVFKNRAASCTNSVMHQDWRHLLFLHWKYPSEEIQKTLPQGLFVDTFNKDAYLTIIPFTIKNFRVLNFPKIPGLSEFTEVNFRTYVVDENGITGIWFYSLDINSFLAAQAAQITYSLPYFFSNISQQISQEITIKGNRIFQSNIEMEFSYKPFGQKTFFAEENSLDFFLIERYVLFSLRSNELKFARVYHKPYPLQDVKLQKFTQNIDISFGFKLETPSHIHYSSGVDVDFSILKDPKSIKK